MDDATKKAALVERLNALCDQQPFHAGWYVKELRSGWSADRHGDVVVPSASTRKTAILMAALRAVHEGRIDLDERVDVDTNLDTTSGCLQWFSPGLRLTLRDLLLMMIIVSDNVSTRHVSQLVGLEAVQALCDSLGMRGTHHRLGVPAVQQPRFPERGSTNETTPRDQVVVLEAILAGAEDATAAARLGVTPELCHLALEILSRQRYKNGIPRFLPEETRVAHKTGRYGGNIGDAGVVYQADRPLFVLAVLTDRVPEELPDGAAGLGAANDLIARLSRSCWDALRAG